MADEVRELANAVHQMEIANTALRSAVEALKETVTKFEQNVVTRDAFDALKGDVEDLQRIVARVGWIIVGSVLLGLLGLLISQGGAA